METGTIIAKRYLKVAGLSWILSPSGCLIIRRNKTSELFVLNENYVLAWLNLYSEMTLEELKKSTKLNGAKLRSILTELESKKLIKVTG